MQAYGDCREEECNNADVVVVENEIGDDIGDENIFDYLQLSVIFND